MKKPTYGANEEQQLRQMLRDENRLLKQELAEQRHVLQKLQTEVKLLSAALSLVNEKAAQLQHAQTMRIADMQLMMYTMADKYMPGNEDFLNKPSH
ncbi:MAG: hypothetical protein SFW65_08345 [Alphaproteobacteria bacterium]|nr:hypothetical protein [Alphaproteobacteria bacterium]